ncbi:MAG TPA: hypothetical protein VII99_11805 [Bacteroidia bacterium]
MYEHHKKPILSRNEFYVRLLRNLLWSAMIIFFSLLLGILGYHFTENLGWLDSLLNASMILTGMGPVNAMTTTAGKLFASFYALFSGIAFLTTMAVVIAPVLHRFLHKFHLDEKEK